MLRSPKHPEHLLDNHYMQLLGRSIKRARKEHGISQKDLDIKLSLPYGDTEDIEAGYGMKHQSSVWRICEYLGVEDPEAEDE